VISHKWCAPRICAWSSFVSYIYINDIDESISIIVFFKFADDTKVFSVVSDINDVNKLQDDLKNLCKWSED